MSVGSYLLTSKRSSAATSLSRPGGDRWIGGLRGGSLRAACFACCPPGAPPPPGPEWNLTPAGGNTDQAFPRVFDLLCLPGRYFLKCPLRRAVLRVSCGEGGSWGLSSWRPELCVSPSSPPPNNAAAGETLCRRKVSLVSIPGRLADISCMHLCATRHGRVSFF